MKKKLLFVIMFLITVCVFTDVNASGEVNISISCPAAAKPNSTITCKVYGSSKGSEIDSIEQIDVEPSGSLLSASYSIDYSIIPLGYQKNIGTVTIKTGNVGTGYINLIFSSIHFVDDSFQTKTSRTKKIIINSTGTVTHHNTVVSGESTNDNNVTNGDTYLKDIKISRGILSPSFSKNVYKYSAKVNSNVDKISIDGVKNDVNQVIEGEVNDFSLKYGKNTFKLVVSNGASPKRTYEIVINRNDNRDTNASLSSLSLSSGNIKFSSNIYEYETKVLYDVNEISVLATPEKTTSTVKVDGQKNLIVGQNTITITVKAEKGNTQKYVVKVIRLNEGEQIGDNSNIKNITISGYDLQFNYSKQLYKLLINKENRLDINVVMDDPNASYEIIGNENLHDGSVISIVTKSYDGTSTQTYNIEIEVTKYTTYYVIAAAIVLLTITVPILFYLKYVKPKKKLVDINGNKLSKEDLSGNEYRKRVDLSVPNNSSRTDVKKLISNDELINQNVSNIGSAQPQYAVNIGEYNNSNAGIVNGKCPKCGRELLGDPSICPYCNNRLR